ncbi:MAG: TatD family hydrolase [Planctomycetaceae bacterium]|nr:TatD family hydrolase [Planctomycetaceae bacterium]
MLIDTHAHLDEQTFDVDREEVLQRAADAGVERILTIGINVATSRAAVELAEQYEMLSAVVGIQPNYVHDVQPGDWEVIEELVTHPQVVGIGETGLDRYWDYAPIDLQREYFDRHLDLSRRVNKPFVVHCREAEADVVEQLRRASDVGSLNGVMHSFCGDADVAEACLEMGMHISFAGMVTYKKSDALRAVAARVPHDRLLVETDAPYLSPVPLRGKRNEPANVTHTAKCVAQQTGLSLERLSAITTANARNLFLLP